MHCLYRYGVEAVMHGSAFSMACADVVQADCLLLAGFEAEPAEGT